MRKRTRDIVVEGGDPVFMFIANCQVRANLEKKSVPSSGLMQRCVQHDSSSLQRAQLLDFSASPARVSSKVQLADQSCRRLQRSQREDASPPGQGRPGHRGPSCCRVYNPNCRPARHSLVLPCSSISLRYLNSQVCLPSTLRVVVRQTHKRQRMSEAFYCNHQSGRLQHTV